VEHLVVVPFFLAPGRHARLDIPRLVERARERHPGLKIQLADVLGDDPLLLELLARRALGALGLER
jgi:sirohydrochlorin cobaltochelatase